MASWSRTSVVQTLHAWESGGLLPLCPQGQHDSTLMYTEWKGHLLIVYRLRTKWTSYLWPCARLWYLQCVSNGATKIFFKVIFVNDGRVMNLLWNCPQVIVTGPHWWKVNIGSGNGLVPSGNKPLPEPMLTQFSSYEILDLSGNGLLK